MRPRALHGGRDHRVAAGDLRHLHGDTGLLSDPKVIHLDDIAAIPGPGTLTWRPVRATLGICAFGCNAYTANEAGVDVVEPHTESPETGHQELYFVAGGRAKFILDGEEHDAPAGTYVFVPDVETHRHAIAEEAGTTVLSFGGPAVFEPSAWEWAFRAGPYLRSDPGEARRILEEGLEHHPTSPSIHYTLACVDALAGNTREALDALRVAVEREPELKAHARKDSDLDSIREDPAFEELTK